MRKIFFIFSILSALILAHGCESYQDNGSQRQEEQAPTEYIQQQNFPDKGGAAGNR